jgi:tetratricopeptide (TPR) repeat protein
MTTTPAPGASPAPSKPASRSKRTTTWFTRYLRIAGKKVVNAFRPAFFLNKTVALLSAIALVAVGALVVALILRNFSPKSQITVSAFEVFATDEKASGLNGKVLADLVVDNLHGILDEAEHFSGSRASSKKSFQPVPDMPHIPVETSYGFEIKGVSVDQLLATWGHIRYREFLISGDLLSGPDEGSVIRIRYTGEGRAKSYESYLRRISAETVQDAVSGLTLDLLEDINPQVAARYLMARFEGCDLRCHQDLDRAIEFSRKWTRVDPDNAQAFFYLAYALASTENRSDALPFYNHAFELDNDLDTALSGKGRILALEGKYGEAESAYKAALSIRKSPNPLMSLGVVATWQGHYQEAENYYRKALAQDKQYVAAYVNLGNALLHLSKNSDAVKAYRQARYLQPDDDAAFRGFVLSLVKDGKPDEALWECEQAARLNPEDDAPLLAKGVVYLKTKQSDRAIQQFKDVLGKTYSQEGLLLLGMAYLEQGNLGSAREISDSLLSDSPKDPRLHHFMAKVLQAQGKFQESKLHADESDCLLPSFKYESLDDL